MQQRQREPENAIASPHHLCAVPLQRFSIHPFYFPASQASTKVPARNSVCQGSALQSSRDSWLCGLCCTSRLGRVFFKSLLSHAASAQPAYLSQGRGGEEKKNPRA